MRDHIVSEIRRIAVENDGQAPGQQLFATKTGIEPHHWRGKFWARWGDALIEAGFAPNRWTERLDPEAVLNGVSRAVRHYRTMPTKDELSLYRSANPEVPSDQAIRTHFGGYRGLASALVKRARESQEWADLAEFLPAEVPERPKSETTAIEGFVYLIRSGAFYKIGRSDDLERRVKQIAIALPDKAELVHAIRTDDPVGIETYWHRRFAEHRANGEWFKLTGRDVAAFKKRKFQ